MFMTIMKASDEQCGSHDMHSFLFRKEPEIYVANCVDGTSSNVLVTWCLEEYSQTSRKKLWISFRMTKTTSLVTHVESS